MIKMLFFILRYQVKRILFYFFQIGGESLTSIHFNGLPVPYMVNLLFSHTLLASLNVTFIDLLLIKIRRMKTKNYAGKHKYLTFF